MAKQIAMQFLVSHTAAHNNASFPQTTPKISFHFKGRG